MFSRLSPFEGLIESVIGKQPLDMLIISLTEPANSVVCLVLFGRTIGWFYYQHIGAHLVHIETCSLDRVRTQKNLHFRVCVERSNMPIPGLGVNMGPESSGAHAEELQQLPELKH
jgi:hypothetical protein